MNLEIGLTSWNRSDQILGNYNKFKMDFEMFIKCNFYRLYFLLWSNLQQTNINYRMNMWLQQAPFLIGLHECHSPLLPSFPSTRLSYTYQTTVPTDSNVLRWVLRTGGLPGLARLLMKARTDWHALELHGHYCQGCELWTASLLSSPLNGSVKQTQVVTIINYDTS